MPDFRRVGRGNAIPTDQQTWNAVLDSARRANDTKAGIDRMGTLSDSIFPTSTLIGYNPANTAIPQWSVVAPTAPSINATYPGITQARPYVDVATPTSTCGPTWVAIDPIPAGGYGRVACSGIVIANINCPYSSPPNQYAHAVAGSLNGAWDTYGPMRILNGGSITSYGLQLVMVELSDPHEAVVGQTWLPGVTAFESIGPTPVSMPTQLTISTPGTYEIDANVFVTMDVVGGGTPSAFPLIMWLQVNGPYGNVQMPGSITMITPPEINYSQGVTTRRLRCLTQACKGDTVTVQASSTSAWTKTSLGFVLGFGASPSFGYALRIGEWCACPAGSGGSGSGGSGSGGGGGGPTWSAVGEATGTGTSLTFSATAPANSILAVLVGSTVSPNSVTFGGTPLSQAIQTGSSELLGIWYLHVTSATTANVVVNVTGVQGILACAVQISGLTNFTADALGVGGGAGTGSPVSTGAFGPTGVATEMWLGAVLLTRAAINPVMGSWLTPFGDSGQDQTLTTSGGHLLLAAATYSATAVGSPSVDVGGATYDSGLAIGATFS